MCYRRRRPVGLIIQVRRHTFSGATGHRQRDLFPLPTGAALDELLEGRRGATAARDKAPPVAETKPVCRKV